MKERGGGGGRRREEISPQIFKNEIRSKSCIPCFEKMENLGEPPRRRLLRVEGRKYEGKSMVEARDIRGVYTHFPSGDDDDSHNFPNYPLIYIPIPVPNLLIHHHARPGSIFREAVSSSRGVVKLAFPSPEPVSVRQRFLSFFTFFFFFFNETAQHSRNRAVPRVTCFT